MSDAAPDPAAALQDAKLCRLCRVIRRLFLLAWVQFILFFVISLWMGGNAGNGRIVDGQPALGMNGRYREVSPDVFAAMRAYEAFSLLLFVVGFAAIILHNRLARCKTVPKRWGIW